jgi:hypothetical protein
MIPPGTPGNIARNKVPAIMSSLRTLSLTVIFRQPRGTYAIARISSGSHFFWQLILDEIWFPLVPLEIS